MVKFLFSVIISLITILIIVFSLNWYVDVLNIFGNKYIDNVYLGTEIAGEREKILSPMFFKDFSYKKIIIGTSKAKFVCNDPQIGNFGLSGLKINEINHYIKLIKEHNKKDINQIFLFIDIEQFILNEPEPKFKVTDNKKYKFLLRYFSFSYFLESIEQIKQNNKLISYKPFIKKENIFSQKQIHIFSPKSKEKLIHSDLFTKNKEELIKELNKLEKNEIILIINPSKKYFLNKISIKQINELEKEIKNKTSLKTINLYDFANNDKDYVDSVHFNHLIGNKIWEEILKRNNDKIKKKDKL